MKVKHVLASLGLALTTAFAVAVGVAPKHEAKSVKADEPDDKMISVVIDLNDAVGYEDFHKPEVHYYGSGIDSYADLHQLTGTYYTANLTYRSSDQSIDNIQFLFKQYAVDKWSNSLEITCKASYVYHFAFTKEWVGDNWQISKDSWEGQPRVRGTNIGDTNFTANISDKSYKVTVTIPSEGFSESNTYQVFFGKWGFGAFRATSVEDYMGEYTLNHFTLKSAGTYDVFIYNTYEDGGIMELKMHRAANETYVYYVLENNVATNDYIYAYGGSEQFGSWPGTKVAEVENVEVIFGNGVIHFQDKATSVLVYKIPVTIGYPTGDIFFKLNNNNDWQSEQRELKSRQAFWYTGDLSDSAAFAIEFLVAAEAIRNAAEDYSVCNVSKSDADTLVTRYISAGSYTQETFIDCTKVLTHKKDGSEGEELVSYRDVMEELAKIAGRELPGSKYNNNTFEFDSNNGILMIVIISTCVVSAIALGTLLILKKKRK